MGETYSRAWHKRVHQDEYPDPHEPPTHDINIGFPNGRKPREMRATWEEMDQIGLKFWERDYCAHHKIDYYSCGRRHLFMANYYCRDLKHNWFQCEYEDHLLRMKEYEREHRLLLRDKRKRQRDEEKKLRAAILEEKKLREEAAAI